MRDFISLGSAKAFGKLVRDAQKATLARCDAAKLDRETSPKLRRLATVVQVGL